MTRRQARANDPGQIIVLFALALLALVAMGGLVIEAGNAFAQQRIAQNGADAAANAGTLVVAQKLSGDAKTGDEVFNAVAASAAANELSNPVAVYTDNIGEPLVPTVTVALGTDIPPNGRGVKVTGDRISGTTLAGLLGIDSLKASAEATAIAGAASGGCPPDTSCGLIPVAFPVQISLCDGSGRLTGIGEPGDLWEIVKPPLTPEKESIVPLCKTAAGAVGWLDLQAGVNLPNEIETPLNDFGYPSWVQTQPGDPNSVEDELNDNYAGKTILIPMFDAVCRSEPPTGYDPCPLADQGVDPIGNNTYYHVPYLASFHLDEAIIQGANVDDCNNHNPLAEPQLISTTPEFLGCLTGWFVDYVLPGEVDPDTTIDDTTVVAIQLVK
jgi:putative Flp pilus-assembly TadE/G-like protein